MSRKRSREMSEELEVKRTVSEPPISENKDSKEKKSDPQEEDVEIVLVIDNDRIACQKSLLCKNSDCFRSMLEGPYLEKDKKTIHLREVEPQAMRNLLAILRNRDHFSTCDDIFAVYRVCGMYLFEDLKAWLNTQMENMLTPTNCTKLWMKSEPLEIVPFSLQAMSTSLYEFHEILNNGTLMELQTLSDICGYLGHVNLRCDSELSVYQAAMTWYHERAADINMEGNAILEELLACIDFKYTPLSEIREMKSFADRDDMEHVSKILQQILNIKLETNFEKNKYTSIAEGLLNSNGRFLPKNPCLLMINNIKKPDGGGGPETWRYQILCYNPTCQLLIPLGNIPFAKCSILAGFGVQDYRMKIYIFGGEFSIGKGSWNKEMWSYDSRSKETQRQLPMPNPRRHFESVVCGDYLYVVGGTGAYRIIQDNMYWYNFKKDLWSQEVMLPCSGRQIKCCNVNKQLFIFSLSDKCGYFFDHCNVSWKQVGIDDTAELSPKTFTPLAILWYENTFFFKGEKLTQLKYVQNKLRVIKITSLPHFYEDSFVESVTNHNFVYTLYKHIDEEDDKISIESLNLDTLEIKFVCEFTFHANEVKLKNAIKLFMFHNDYSVAHKKCVKNVEVVEET